MKALSEFYKDTATRDNVKNYLIEFFKEEGVRRLMAREDAVAVADAVELVEKAFENMDTLFSSKVIKKSNINEAR
jgi:hypothetical protein